MARIARVVAPGFPHHITQRGNRRQQTFFTIDDYRAYLDLMAEWSGWYKVEIWAYCLMPNHVHIIAVPQDEDGLRLAIGESHRRFTRRINFRYGWRGHLWQGRFASYPMDETYLLAAARYVELNPVKSKLCVHPEDYPWSSAPYHVDGKEDPLVKQSPLVEMAGDWKSYLSEAPCLSMAEALKQAERTGRPLGSEKFVAELENTLGRMLKRKKPGPKSS
ncbi:MAG: transposase [Geobacteraceae bacterium]|nr:transposase [Geobacteraceae bacterium]